MERTFGHSRKDFHTHFVLEFCYTHTHTHTYRHTHTLAPSMVVLVFDSHRRDICLIFAQGFRLAWLRFARIIICPFGMKFSCSSGNFHREKLRGRERKCGRGRRKQLESKSNVANRKQQTQSHTLSQNEAKVK